MTYSYDPTKIKARGKDQMRFELGDTQIDGGADTCALSDEEYEAMLVGLKDGKKAWLLAKLATLESILFKMQHQVNMKIDVLQYDFGDRAERWQNMYGSLKKQILATASIPRLSPSIRDTAPYFHKGMEENPRAMYDTGELPFRHMTS